jgi:hypothetical protein
MNENKDKLTGAIIGIALLIVAVVIGLIVGSL